MSDFESALQDRLARNAELADRRARAEREMDQAKAEAEEQARRAAEEQRAAQVAHHRELTEHLGTVTDGLKRASPEQFVVRMGWTQSGEEFIAKISTRGLDPARSLFIELDRDDDEVLVRWHSDVGRSLELWRLLEVTPGMLSTLLLQVADQALWRGADGPPPFPRAEDAYRA